MQSINPQMAKLLSQMVRSPRAYASIQLPLQTDPSTNTYDYTKLGSILLLNDILSIRRVNIYQTGSDSLDISVSGQGGIVSPLNSSSPYGKYFYPGAADTKIQVWMGLINNGVETIYPKGIFINESTKQQNDKSQNTASISALDQWSTFQGYVYTQFPPKLYGNQTTGYYNPNYKLVPLNTSGGNASAWGGDTLNWMTQAADAPAFASDYVPVAVYVDTTGGSSPASVPYGSPYAIDYARGEIFFGTAIPSTSIVSVDARPLAMTPEKMLYHLFVDFGFFNPSFLKFDTSGIVLPILQNAWDQPITDVANEIAQATAPRGIQWRLYFDENGYLVFTENAIDGPPVKTFVDVFDILKSNPEYTARNISNVVRATGRAANNQPLIAISYDVTSLSIFTQRATYDIPYELVAATVGMDPGSAMFFMQGLTNSMLSELSTPSIQYELEIPFDPALQVGDAIVVMEYQTGLNKQFYIEQITEEIQGPDCKQTLRVQEFKGNQDFQFGVSFYAGAPEPQNANAIQTNDKLINAVEIGGVTVVQNGQPILDSNLNQIIATWNGGSLPISISLFDPNTIASGSHVYLWRWMYISEDVYDQNGLPLTAPGFSGSSPYSSQIPVDFPNWDYLNGQDSPRARRLYWPIMRCVDWANDGPLTPYTSAVTLNSKWSGGPGNYGYQGSIYGNLRVGLSNYFGGTSPNYSGVSVFAQGTPAQTILGGISNVKYGLDWGNSYNGQVLTYGIKRKYTPCFLGLLAIADSGVCQLKRIPFQLVI